jgi:hypothetical protein
MLCGEQKGMRRRGPQPGTPNAADPATVLQRGFSIRSAVSELTGRRVRPAFGEWQNGKATGVATRSAGAGRLFLYESSALSCCRQLWEGEENPTVLERTTTCEPGDLPSTGMVPTLGRFPRCQHGGCRGDVLYPRVHGAPTVPIRLCGSCIDPFFARVWNKRRRSAASGLGP